MHKKDFPIFKHHPRLVYLDSAATSLKPSCVTRAILDYYEKYSANVHRGLYDLSEKATREYENARIGVQKFINAKSPKEIIFTRGATEAINIVALTWASQNVRSGDDIIISVAEHHSNLVPWQLLAKKRNAVLKFADVNSKGILDIDQFSRLLSRRTRMVAFSHVSNALGTINPVKFLTQKAHAVGAKILIDAAQSAPHMPMDVQELDCDFLAFSGHKMCGPTGIGVLYAKEKILEKTEPLFGGGDMIREVYKTHSKWNDLPWKFEAGTPPIAQAIGLGAAIKYLQKIGMSRIREHEKKLTSYALAELSKIPAVELYGPCDPRIQSGVISFNIKGIHAHDVADILNQEGIAVRAGHHCCMPLMERLGIAATIRASFYLYSTEEDVDKLVKAIKKIKKIFS